MNKFFEQVKNNWDEITQKMLNDNDEISTAFFDAFIKTPLNLLKYEKNVLYIEVPEEGYINILKKRFIPNFLKISISEVLNTPLSDFDISFIVKNNIYSNQTISKEIIEKRLLKLKIDPKNTFQNFVQGESNRMAYGSSIAVAETQAIYNPLIIYGGAGLGKTHLLHAITHHAIEQNENLNIIYITCSEFKTEFYLSIKENKTSELIEKYKNVDYLIIDDIQFLSNAKETQNAFFDIFNSLYTQKKQIILSSDRPPKEIDNLPERLTSRFSWGLFTDITVPDFETRIAILLKKQEEFNPEFPVDMEVIRYIAQTVKTNIRELEGCLTKIIAGSRLQKKQINLELAKEMLNSGENENKKITPENIINTVSDTLNVDILDICGKSRKTDFVYSRNISIYLCRELIPDITQEKIGSFFGDRDHSTIIHSCKQIEKDIKINKNLQEDIKIIKNKLLI